MANATFDTLFIERPVLSTAAILHAAAFLGIEPPDPSGLHVTLACSTAQVNWRAPVFLEDPSFLWLAPQTMPVVRLGQNGEYLALKVSSTALQQRHAALRAAGASWNHPIYQPHITLGPAPARDLPEVVTFLKVIELGPERRKALEF